MSPYDKELIKKRFAKHLEQYNIQSTVQLDICNRMGGLFDLHIDKDFVANKTGYEIGAGTGFLTKILLNKYPKTQWVINDIVEQTKTYLNNIIVSSEASGTQISICDAENSAINNQFSIVASASSVQWFDSLEQYIKKISNHIVDGGYFAFSTFGANNFIQISTLTESVITYHSIEQICRWARENGFETLFCEQYNTDMRFDSPYEVVRYIKETGLNANSKKKWSRTEFEEFCNQYTKKYSNDGTVSLTFNPMIFIFKKIGATRK